MHTPLDIDQNTTTDVDKMIREFRDRKVSTLRKLSDKIAERLAPSVRTSTTHGESIAYERLKWTSATPRG